MTKFVAYRDFDEDGKESIMVYCGRQPMATFLPDDEWLKDHAHEVTYRPGLDEREER